MGVFRFSPLFPMRHWRMGKRGDLFCSSSEIGFTPYPLICRPFGAGDGGNRQFVLSDELAYHGEGVLLGGGEVVVDDDGVELIGV